MAAPDRELTGAPAAVMPSDLVQRGALFFDLSARAKFRVTGADRLRFLNGQITNDLRKATSSAAIEACILNAKGKLDAHVFMRTDAEAVVIDADPELRETLPARLDRYIIADDVQIEDISERFGMFHFIGSEPPTGVREAMVVAADRLGSRGWDLIFEIEKKEELQQQLAEQFHFCDAECAELFRIEHGIPRWGRELTNEIIPVEANLEERSIDYAKGCYIGQEVISRMKMSGQTNKHLCGLISLSDAPLHTTMRLRQQDEPGKDVGWITSAARSSRLGKEIALGYVKRGFNSAGTRLQAFQPGQSDFEATLLEIVPLPFG